MKTANGGAHVLLLCNKKAVDLIGTKPPCV